MNQLYFVVLFDCFLLQVGKKNVQGADPELNSSLGSCKAFFLFDTKSVHWQCEDTAEQSGH